MVVWYYPNVVFVDKDITTLTREVHDAEGFGKTPSIVSFSGTRITCRRTDGAYFRGDLPSLLVGFVRALLGVKHA